MALLRVDAVSKSFTAAGATIPVLSGVSFELDAGRSLAFVGPSGSGKSTLLGICAGLERPTAGEVWIEGDRWSSADEDQLARWRRERVGFVFQAYHLIPTLTVLENVMFPLELLAVKRPRPAAEAALADVGLDARRHHYPTQLSGGEQQRAAIARALVHRPKIVFADEPTGNLDNANAEAVANLLFDRLRQTGAALVVVTHNEALARRADRVVHLDGGRVRT